MKIGIVIVAAGSGERFAAGIPKQYRRLHGKPMVQHSMERLHAYFPDAVMVLVQNPEHQFYVEACNVPHSCHVVAGGATRQASVKAGLEGLHGQHITRVLIHDAARPFVDAATCARLIAALETNQAVIPALAIADTVKRVQGNIVRHTLNRSELVSVQTPQAFDYEMLLTLHMQAEAEGWEGITDDAGLCERAGVKVATVEGARCMGKVTVQEDVPYLLAEGEVETRIGQGYDVHRLLPFAENTAAEQRFLTLGGITVPHTHYLEGHSDADVVLHALTDAILGAIGEGDIGQHFPPSDASFKQMDSALFVRHACALMEAKGGSLINTDITVIGERPKITPVRDAMRKRIAEILDIDARRVNIKATTTERLGFEGRGEGLAAQVVVSVRYPTYAASTAITSGI
jgi:2-C-methyl-D-erythritol 4-phosphate cytidylyltransferase / 2-C-methyl-D-erythritol 2,4-cyclodiphosphate synthase